MAHSSAETTTSLEQKHVTLRVCLLVQSPVSLDQHKIGPSPRLNPYFPSSFSRSSQTLSWCSATWRIRPPSPMPSAVQAGWCARWVRLSPRWTSVLPTRLTRSPRRTSSQQVCRRWDVRILGFIRESESPTISALGNQLIVQVLGRGRHGEIHCIW